MMSHFKFNEVLTLVENNISVLLTGEKGTGKTTLAKQIADKLELKFYSMSMTRQTTLSHLLGFMSINGTYVPTLFKEAFENGGLMLLDEIDAADANVLLSINTIENGYLSFPTGIINAHPDFRLMATANPANEHNAYTGRSKLDAATLDRFDIVEIERDSNLEKSLIDFDTSKQIDLLRDIIKETNSSVVVSMRDAMRYQKRKDLLLTDNYIFNLVDKSNLIYDKYTERLNNLPKYADQSECLTITDLWSVVTCKSE